MKQTLSLQSRLRIPECILSHNLQGEEVVLDLANGVYWGLDEIGTRIWTLLHEHDRPEDILRIMLEEYDVAEDCLRQDLHDLVTRLEDNGLVEVLHDDLA